MEARGPPPRSPVLPPLSLSLALSFASSVLWRRFYATHASEHVSSKRERAKLSQAPMSEEIRNRTTFIAVEIRTCFWSYFSCFRCATKFLIWRSKRVLAINVWLARRDRSLIGLPIIGKSEYSENVEAVFDSCALGDVKFSSMARFRDIKVYGAKNVRERESKMRINLCQKVHTHTHTQLMLI